MVNFAPFFSFLGQYTIFMSSKVKSILIILIILFLDQSLKIWIKTNMMLDAHNRQKFIELSYQNLQGYLDDIPEKSRPKFYAQTVIIGFLAAGFGHLFDEKMYQKTPSGHQYYTEYLNSQTKYICQRINDKGRRSAKKV